MLQAIGNLFYHHCEVVHFCVAIAAVLVFVLRCRLSWCLTLAGSAFVALACSRALVFRLIGGSAFYPFGVPEVLVRILDVAYFGTVVLVAVATPLFFWRSRLKALVLPAVAYSVSLVGVLNAVATPVVREYVVVSDRLPPSLDGYRIVHLSDLHASCGCRRWHTQRVVDVVNGLGADLVCITGDLADGHPRDCADYLVPLLALRAKDGVYAVTGNHEFDANVNPVREWSAYYADWRLPFLRNACVFPRRGLALGGVDDRGRDGVGLGGLPDVSKAFAAATNGEFRVLLQHRPDEFEENVATHKVDLQLSGHLHGGFMPLFRERIADEYNGRIQGLYDFGAGYLCLSAGCGPWGGFPIRYFTPLEIGLVTLRRGP